MTVRFWLPFPPSVNAAWGNNKSGKGKGRYRTTEYKKWMGDSAAILASQVINPIEHRCKITIDLDDRRNGDCDNRAKAILDLLVYYKVLRGDSKKYVQRMSIGWENVEECWVTIEEA